MLRCNVETDYDDHHTEHESLDIHGGLHELGTWIFGQMCQDYSGPHMHWPKKAGDGFSFTPEKYGPEIIIHMIVDPDRGILYSDGMCTNGQQHVSHEVAEWSEKAGDYTEHPVYKFVD